MVSNRSAIPWPPKHDVCGVGISKTSYGEIVDILTGLARHGGTATVTPLAVHGLVTAGGDPGFGSKVNRLDIVAPDGQPVRWALNMLYGAHLDDRVYGPELMWRLCKKAADENWGVYLYGSHRHVVERLKTNLVQRIEGLNVVGCEPSIFRPLTGKEDQALVNRINSSGARLLFLGLGCPLQEAFAYEHRSRFQAIQVCSGAAFDFHAGNKKTAPGWMQKRGLEWLFRLKEEPQRLWKRYLVTNTLFLFRFTRQFIRQKAIYPRTETQRKAK